MKIAFLGVRVPGHLNPMTTLARKLKGRGHDVVFLSMPDTEPFVPPRHDDHPCRCDQCGPSGIHPKLNPVWKLSSSRRESCFSTGYSPLETSVATMQLAPIRKSEAEFLPFHAHRS
jgi:hypothetical protein